MEELTFRRADGREVSLREFPMAELMNAAEKVRAEEIVLRVADGRSVTVLLNATPILSEKGAVSSMVVTLQDMADVEELERLRAEFLAMVSHELRIPLTSIKGSATTIMEAGTDLDPAVMRQFVRIIGDQADHMNALVADLLDVARIETGTLPVGPEPADVAMLVDRACGGNDEETRVVETETAMPAAESGTPAPQLNTPAPTSNEPVPGEIEAAARKLLADELGVGEGDFKLNSSEGMGCPTPAWDAQRRASCTPRSLLQATSWPSTTLARHTRCIPTPTAPIW